MVGYIEGVNFSADLTPEDCVDNTSYEWAKFRENIHSPLTIKRMKIKLVKGALFPGIFEEIQFRYLLQDWILTRIPKKTIACILPGKESYLNSNLYKAIKILITAYLFSEAHRSNTYMCNLTIKESEYQLVNTFVLGIILGIAKESRLGLSGAIGLHAGNNLQALALGWLKESKNSPY